MNESRLPASEGPASEDTGSEGLAPAVREQVERFVRPLYTELDGVQTFPRVARLEAWIRRLRSAGANASARTDPRLRIDPEYLELLVLLIGVTDRLGSTRPESRFGLFLRTLSVPQTVRDALPAGLARTETAPVDLEEELLHDALLLERSGVSAAARRMLLLGKKKTPLSKVARQLSPGPALDRFRLEPAREIARRRRAAAEAWIEQLRDGLQADDFEDV